ncbi:hypothetical protein BJ508DRAFT_312130 [Ascobolus immersus RN42]|uniref:Uncharacterized protein n=1 Tax=Ascobolus immersus RN42 TaxID=1160509 RepID=A0A3N4HU16_ASCIM|nr:hypothetical protein BJ508DRAFT_312130 [Ascobolus immersus RN42]
MRRKGTPFSSTAAGIGILRAPVGSNSEHKADAPHVKFVKAAQSFTVHRSNSEPFAQSSQEDAGTFAESSVLDQSQRQPKRLGRRKLSSVRIVVEERPYIGTAHGYHYLGLGGTESSMRYKGAQLPSRRRWPPFEFVPPRNENRELTTEYKLLLEHVTSSPA